MNVRLKVGNLGDAATDSLDFNSMNVRLKAQSGKGRGPFGVISIQ